MKNRVLIVLVLVAMLLPVVSFAQREEVGDAITFHDTTWYDRGFDFYIGAGMFWGGKKSALYYNGSKYNECNLNYIFNNPTDPTSSYYKALQEAVIKVYPYVSYSDIISYKESDLNLNPTYNLAVSINLGVRYKIRDNWGISLSYNFARLKTVNKLLLNIEPQLPSNTYRLPELTLLGVEDRSMIDLSASYLFSDVSRLVKPFLEVGAQFNYVRVKKFDAVLLDDRNNPVYTQTLLDIYGGANYVPGVDMQTYDVIYGGPGFGGSFSAGLKIVVNKFVSLDPTFYGCFSYLHLRPYGEKVTTFNYGVMLRVVVNDFFMHNNM